jgi:serine/threonine protein kinase
MGTSYEKVRDLGKVPLGHAWVGRDAGSDLHVVVKKIPLDAIGGGGNGWTGLVNETKTLTRLAHDNVAAALEVAEEGDHLVMVTARPHGRRLSDIMRGSEPISISQLRAWMLPLLEGLAIAHDSGVIHRHVHESLVVVDDEDVAVLTGFALTLDARVEPEPIPPELLNGGKATALSDQFLVGAMLARLARESEPVPALDIVVARATDDDPGRRFADVIDLQQSLAAVLDSAADPDRRAENAALVDSISPRSPAERPRAAEVVDERAGNAAAPEVAARIVVQDLHEPIRRTRPRRFLVPAIAAGAVIAVGMTLMLGFFGSEQTVDTETSVFASTPARQGPMDRVGELLAEGRVDQAAAELEDILRSSDLADPTPALDALGTIRLQEGRGEEAVELFERALGLHAGEALYYKLSLAQASVGLDDKALRTVDEGLRLFPQSQRLQEAKFHLGGA